jgi:hypothetical protein
MKSTHQVLVDAKELIKDPKDWFGKGRPCEAADQKCMLLAINYAATDATANSLLDAYGPVTDALFTALPSRAQVGPGRWNAIARFNDTHVHRSCMKVMDRAIAATAP